MQYQIVSHKFNSDFIHEEIQECLKALYSLNEMLFDYWLCELYDDNDEEVTDQWTENHLRQMYDDVDSQKRVYLSEVALDQLTFA